MQNNNNTPDNLHTAGTTPSQSGDSRVARVGGFRSTVRRWLLPVLAVTSLSAQPGCQQMTDGAIKSVGVVVDKTFEGLGKLGSAAVNFVEKKVSRAGDKLNKYYGKIVRSKAIPLSRLEEAYNSGGATGGKRKKMLANIYQYAVIPAGQSKEFAENLANIPAPLQKKYEEWFMAAVAMEYVSNTFDSIKDDANDLEDDAEDMVDDPQIEDLEKKLQDAKDVEENFRESNSPYLTQAIEAKKAAQRALNVAKSGTNSARNQKLDEEGKLRDALYELRDVSSGLVQAEVEARDAFFAALADYNATP